MKVVRPINDQTPNVTNPYSSVHKGTDYGYPAGEKVYASADGKVTIAKGYETRSWVANTASDPYPHPRALRTEDYGNFLKIGHAENFSTLYAHLKYDSLYVEAGQTVTKGQLIAEVGTTGNSTGNHLHWEVRINDVVVDPAPYMEPFTNYGGSPSTPSTDIDQIRKERDTNWLLYQDALKQLNDMRLQRDENWRLYEAAKAMAGKSYIEDMRKIKTIIENAKV